MNKGSIVICIDPGDSEDLTKYNFYRVEQILNGVINITNDQNRIGPYRTNKFVDITKQLEKHTGKETHR